MAWQVEFLPAADKTLGRLDRQHQRRIQKFIQTRLLIDEDSHVAIGDRKELYR